MQELSIGEVARQVGVRASTLRYYESAGILRPPKRVNGQRRYDPAVLRHLAIIQRAQQSGFTIAEIGELMDGFTPDASPPARWHELTQRKIAELNAQIERTQEMRDLLEEGLRCGCLSLDVCPFVPAPGELVVK